MFHTNITKNYTETNINYKINNYNGGFFTYWILYFSFPKMIINSSIYTKFQKFELLYDVMFWKSIWYLVIKPIGYIFHSKITYNGVIKTTEFKETFLETGEYLNMRKEQDFEVKKTYILFFLRIIPIWFWKTKKMSNEDKDYLLK